MKKITVDTTGTLCPAPLIATRKKIKEALTGDILEVLTDNDTAYSNLINYLAELNIAPKCTKKGYIHILTFEKPEILSTEIDSKETHPHMICGNGYVVAIKSNTMGQGDDELGAILMRSFINSLSEADALPRSIVLYNSGVKVATADSDTADSLAALENKGVEIIICGTCVDFYELTHAIKIGTISNMFKITTVLSEAGHIIYP